MKCDRCGQMVPETTTGTCLVSHGVVFEMLPNLKKENIIKLCQFDDQFFCKECLSKDICLDCVKILTLEEQEIIRNSFK